MKENISQLKAFYGFNEEYFKVGQLIKVTGRKVYFPSRFKSVKIRHKG